MKKTQIIALRLLAHHKPLHTEQEICVYADSSTCVIYNSFILEVVIQGRLSYIIIKKRITYTMIRCKYKNNFIISILLFLLFYQFLH